METSVIKRFVAGYALYYLDSPKITTDEAKVPATMLANEGPFEIAYIHKQDIVDRATQVIVQITCDRVVDNACIGRVIYVWTVNIINDASEDEYQLVGATKMHLAGDLTISGVNVTAVVNGQGVNVPEYNIQLRSRFDDVNHTTKLHKSHQHKKITKISRK